MREVEEKWKKEGRGGKYGLFVDSPSHPVASAFELGCNLLGSISHFCAGKVDLDDLRTNRRYVSRLKMGWFRGEKRHELRKPCLDGCKQMGNERGIRIAIRVN